MNLVVAGTGPLEMDAIGSCFTGIDPKSVEYLAMIAESRGRGLDPSRMEIKGESVESMMRKLEWYYPWTTELMVL